MRSFKEKVVKNAKSAMSLIAVLAFAGVSVITLMVQPESIDSKLFFHTIAVAGLLLTYIISSNQVKAKQQAEA